MNKITNTKESRITWYPQKKKSKSHISPFCLQDILISWNLFEILYELNSNNFKPKFNVIIFVSCDHKVQVSLWKNKVIMLFKYYTIKEKF